MPQRIFRTIVHNRTSSLRLVRTAHRLCGGIWTPGGWTPPETIESGTSGGMQSESSGIMTGTEGWVKYNVIWGVRTLGMIYLYWTNPWYGVTYPRFATHASDVEPDCGGTSSADTSTFVVEADLPFHLVPVRYGHTQGGGNITAPGDLAHAFAVGPIGGIVALFGLKGIVKDPVVEYELKHTPYVSSGSSPLTAPAQLRWSPVKRFAEELGKVDAVTLIQSNFGSSGNLEVICRVGDRLYHYWREDKPPWNWHRTRAPGPGMNSPQIAAGVGGTPALVQSRLPGAVKGNFEVVVPSSGRGLMHFSRNND